MKIIERLGIHLDLSAICIMSGKAPFSWQLCCQNVAANFWKQMGNQTNDEFLTFKNPILSIILLLSSALSDISRSSTGGDELGLAFCSTAPKIFVDHWQFHFDILSG